MSDNFDLVVPSPRTVLQLLPRQRLVELSRELDVAVKANATKDAQIAALSLKTRTPLQQILRALGRDELKLACRSHHIDERGRSRDELIRRILAAGKQVSDSPEPATSRQPMKLVPEKGDLAVVRQRQYLVTEVIPPAQPGTMTQVRLVCLDDDAQGRTLEVLWELELGARILNAEAHWPTAIERLDEPREFAAYFHALKWNRVTATDANLFQAPFHAGIALKSYQLTPLRKALSLPRANLFIADDVGLGKTIEAGLIVQELILRQRVDFVLIVCPASVSQQWKLEMDRRFGLGFEIYNRDFVGRRRQERGFQVNPWSTHHRFIVSYQTFRRPEYRDSLLHFLDHKRKKSLLILDEAHNAAPASASKYAVDSLTTKAIRDLTTRFENRLFLSATPHNGHSNSFSALLEMLDPQRFLRGTAVSGPEQLAPVMVRRLKPDLVALGTTGFPQRRLVQLDLVHEQAKWQSRTVTESGPPRVTPLGSGRAVELELSEMLAEYTALACPPKGRGRIVFINLQKRLLSSIEAFARTLEKHANRLKGDAISSDPNATLDPDETEEGVSADALDDQNERLVGDASARLNPLEPRAAELLERMLTLAQQHRNGADAKARALVAWIREHLCPAVSLDGSNPKASQRWSARRVIVFTEYGHTKTYLRKLLNAACEGTDLAEERIQVFDGGMSEDRRALLQEEFNGDPATFPVRLLLCTDAAREGVNLQGHCADLFHYDIPWNPGRLEQRNGRIDRTLQPEKEVRCHYFFYPQRSEDEVMRAVVRKVGRIQRELGSVGSVVFDGIADLLEHQGLSRAVLTSIEAEEERIRATSSAAKELEEQRARDLEAEVNDAERLLNDSREILEFDPVLLRDAIDVGLRWSGAKPLETVDSPREEPELAAYQLPELSESWTATLDSARPARKRDESIREWRDRGTLPVVFDAPQKLSTPVVQLHLKHPIVQRILGRFLSQGYSAHDLSRVTVLKNKHDSVPRVVALGRLSIFGHGATRLHDQLLIVAAAFSERNAKLTPFGEEEDRKAVDQLELLFARAPNLSQVDSRVQDKLRALAPKHFAELWPHLQQEADAQAHAVERKLRKRGETEATALRKIISAQIQVADRTLEHQLSFNFAEGEREQASQLDRDRKHIAARRAILTQELEHEPAAIRTSYEILRRRVESVGLVYLWPTTR